MEGRKTLDDSHSPKGSVYLVSSHRHNSLRFCICFVGYNEPAPWTSVTAYGKFPLEISTHVKYCSIQEDDLQQWI